MPSHNCIIIHNVQFSRCSWISLRNSMKSLLLRRNFSQSLSFFRLVEISGIEPLTSCLQGRRSPSWAKPPYRRNQIHNLRIDLCKLNARLCLCFSSSPSNPLRWALPGTPNCFKKWWAKMDSNHRPHDYQSCALASWAIGPYRLLTSQRYIFPCTL